MKEIETGLLPSGWAYGFFPSGWAYGFFPSGWAYGFFPSAFGYGFFPSAFGYGLFRAEHTLKQRILRNTYPLQHRGKMKKHIKETADVATPLILELRGVAPFGQQKQIKEK